jgi:hypothetical protein
MPAQPFLSPTLYQLAGAGLQLTYSTSGIDGRPHLHYQDSQHNQNFVGDQIRAVACDLGTLVSVTIQLTVDAGSTSFTVLIPRINLQSGETGQVSTDGILTVHRFAIVPAFNHGQLDHYTVSRLHGTARHVLF